MPPALKAQVGAHAETEGAVRPVHFFLDDDVPPEELTKRYALQVFVSRLKPGTGDVARARVFAEGHGPHLHFGEAGCATTSAARVRKRACVNAASAQFDLKREVSPNARWGGRS
jgi:hypothetical protein